MKVFISWSQNNSKKIALILKETFERFFNDEIKFWVSSVDITAGGFSVKEIVDALKSSDIAITCLDKSNLKKNWLYFETGFILGKNHCNQDDSPIIFPFIFDNTKIDDFFKTPFQDLQLKYFNKENVHNMLLSINDKYKKINTKHCISPKYFNEQFDLIWNTLYNSVNNIIKQGAIGGDDMLTEENVADKISKYGFPTPTYGDVLEYSTGFETHDFYKFLLENVSKRLYIFGRKNRKLTDRSFKDALLSVLNKKIDLRLLYLNPTSPFAESGIAQDLDDFKSKLITSIKEFAKMLQDDSFDSEQYCRMYGEKRESEIIIADNVVFYKDLAYSEDGKPAHFTNSKFYVVAINSELGSTYYEIFNNTWNNNEKNKVDSTFINSLKRK